MDRVLEAPTPVARKSSKKEEIRLLFPGETTWEWWSLPSRQAAVLKSSTPVEEAALKSRESTRVALPSRHVLIFPIWLATTEASLMQDMVFLELERQGLSGPRQEVTSSYQAVKQENNRSLLIVSVLTENFPEEFCFPKVKDYRLATDYWALPSNQLIVWKELGSLIFGFTSGEHLVYLQSSPAASIHGSFIHEAHCAHLQLESEGSLPALHGITIFGNFPMQEMENLRTGLHLPLQRLDRPSPITPRTNRSLVPARVLASRKISDQKRRNSKFLTIGVLLYLLLACGFLGQLGWLAWKKNVLNQNLASHRQEVSDLRSTFKRWQALELAILPETYPIEMLFRSTRHLPEEGVRLLTYDQNGTRINLTGESKNALAALQFFDALKKSPELDAYSWEMAAPDLLPNDSARFVIEGKRRDASP